MRIDNLSEHRRYLLDDKVLQTGGVREGRMILRDPDTREIYWVSPDGEIQHQPVGQAAARPTGYTIADLKDPSIEPAPELQAGIYSLGPLRLRVSVRGDCCTIEEITGWGRVAVSHGDTITITRETWGE